jgi:hypothetical protein
MIPAAKLGLELLVEGRKLWDHPKYFELGQNYGKSLSMTGYLMVKFTTGQLARTSK